jgi:hypothetical protein
MCVLYTYMPFVLHMAFCGASNSYSQSAAARNSHLPVWCDHCGFCFCFMESMQGKTKKFSWWVRTGINIQLPVASIAGCPSILRHVWHKSCNSCIVTDGRTNTHSTECSMNIHYNSLHAICHVTNSVILNNYSAILYFIHGAFGRMVFEAQR